jgi:hypothetical protein
MSEPSVLHMKKVFFQGLTLLFAENNSLLDKPRELPTP